MCAHECLQASLKEGKKSPATKSARRFVLLPVLKRLSYFPATSSSSCKRLKVLWCYLVAISHRTHRELHLNWSNINLN